MQTIARNFAPLVGFAETPCYLTEEEAVAESLEKTRELRFAAKIVRAQDPCVHGNVRLFDFSNEDRFAGLQPAGHYRAPRAWTSVVPEGCDCDGDVDFWSPLFVNALTGSRSDDDSYERYHDKGRCGGCTPACGDGDQHGCTLDEYLALEAARDTVACDAVACD